MPFSFPWLQLLNTYQSVDDMRDVLAERHQQASPSMIDRVIVLGASEEGARFVSRCNEVGIEVVALADDNPDKIGQQIDSIFVTPTSGLLEFDRNTPVIIASHRVLEAVARLKNEGFATVVPLALMQILDPGRFPPHMFYDGLLENLYEDREKLHKLANRLADDASRRTMDAVVGFRMTFDSELLRPVLDMDLYFPEGVFELGSDEVFLDCGTYDGDSIRWFIERSKGNYERIVGFEPDTATYQKLKENFSDNSRIETVNKGVYLNEAVLHFDNAGTRGSLLSEPGTKSGIGVPVCSIDDFLSGGRATYIKMNIEGAEIAALKGARQTILKWQPKLAISVYHRPADLWEIAAVIDSISPNYKFYLRQHDGGIIETVLYAIPTMK